MTIAFAAGAAVLGIACAIGHSLISERKLLRPLYAEPRGGLLAARSMRDITRGIFHMPSMVWAVLGIAVLAARIEGGNQLLSIVAAKESRSWPLHSRMPNRFSPRSHSAPFLVRSSQPIRRILSKFVSRLSIN
jgi:hypothetical protein